MFRSYKISDQTAVTSGADKLDENEEMDENRSNNSIEINKISKFHICLCRLSSKGGLEYISNFVDTELIEESEFIVIHIYLQSFFFRQR